MEAVAEITAAVKNVPALRFPEFEGEWEQKRFGDITKRISDPVNVEKDEQYQQIGVKSHGRGLFHKEFVNGESLGNKRVFWIKEDAFIVNIVFAWEQAVGKTTAVEKGMIASHRFPMYLPVKDQTNLDYLVYFFLTMRGKFLLELASPGGAGRNKTLGQKELENIKFLLPSLHEQQKIASSLTAIDDKIKQLSNKKALLERYKKGVMQKIFSQQIGFKDDNGNDFPEWEVKKAKEVFKNHSNKKHNGDLPILAITQDKGTVLRDSIDIDIKSSEASIKSYKIIEEGDFIISLRSFQGGIEYSDITGICSPAYTILKSTIGIDTTFFKYYFKKESFIKQLSNTVVGIRDGKQISYDAFSGMKLLFPSVAEQNKIGKFLTSIDIKIDLVTKEIEQAQQFKKGLLQQMFV